MSRYQFDPVMLNSLVGGLSVLEVHRLNIQSLDQAKEFIKAYGFDVDNVDDNNRLWNYYRRAVTYIKTAIVQEGDDVPEVLSDPNQLKDIAYLLIYASTHDPRENSLQRWACAILKVVHVLVHFDNDLFTAFSSEIQEQILKPIQKHIHADPVSGISLGPPSTIDSIRLAKFDIKAFKRSESSITKLLAKPEVVAFTVLDKMGIRIVTRSLFDVFRVMKYLLKENIVSFPHNIPDQSNNTLYPINILLEVMEGFTDTTELSVEQIDKILLEKLASVQHRAQYRQKFNPFTGADYRFVKFITRRLIRVTVQQNSKPHPLSFFYPYEVQIVDYQTYLKNLTGPSSHEEYKKRQRSKARARILGIPL